MNFYQSLTTFGLVTV